MANRNFHPKMSQADRAKQFMPFAALKGLPEALAKKEKVIVSKMELSEEYKEELDRTFQQIKGNDIVSIVYFHDDSYEKITGMVSRIDTNAGFIQIVTTKIFFSDIAEIIPEQKAEDFRKI